MPDFFNKIQEDQGTVEDIVRRIPGFKGYFEKQDRRAADEALREFIAREFEELLGRFTNLQKELVRSGGIMHMERAQSIDTKLRTFIDRIESAAQGYAGLFDAMKAKEDELARLYAFDQTLLAYKDQFDEGLDEMERSIGKSEGLEGILRQLESIVTEANDTFKRRSEAMHDLQDSV